MLNWFLTLFSPSDPTRVSSKWLNEYELLEMKDVGYQGPRWRSPKEIAAMTPNDKS